MMFTHGALATNTDPVSMERPANRMWSTIDPVIGRAPCDATLVKLGPEDGRGEGDIMVLAGRGPHAPVAARRAAEFVSAAGNESSLTLLNVQPPETDSDENSSPPNVVKQWSKS